MQFVDALVQQLRGTLIFMLVANLLLVPFIIAEQIRPVHRRPMLRDYGFNIFISFSTTCLALPIGMTAGFLSEKLSGFLPWDRINFSYSNIADVPAIGSALQFGAMIFMPLFVHDFWFYWAHRIEHRVKFLWEFHKIHHSDELMNSSTWARDHFLQSAFRAFFPALTLGLVFNINAVQAGQAALFSALFLTLLSMFYHSAIRVRLPWMDRVLVTPQVHRIHHSTQPEHFNRNFADALPIFDIVFGTYHRPGKDEFPETGLQPEFPAPKSVFRAQWAPVISAVRTLSMQAAATPAASTGSTQQ
jgi:sterol desaturase/sphingolipid hydroxylase (fatty acid hydroxylase superfamily)